MSTVKKVAGGRSRLSVVVVRVVRCCFIIYQLGTLSNLMR